MKVKFCPYCGNLVTREQDLFYVCENGHAFDVTEVKKGKLVSER